MHRFRYITPFHNFSFILFQLRASSTLRRPSSRRANIKLLRRFSTPFCSRSQQFTFSNTLVFSTIDKTLKKINTILFFCRRYYYYYFLYHPSRVQFIHKCTSYQCVRNGSYSIFFFFYLFIRTLRAAGRPSHESSIAIVGNKARVK